MAWTRHTGVANLSSRRAGDGELTKLIMPTPGDEQRFLAQFPQFSTKCVVIPSYMPWIEAIDETMVLRKQAAGGKLRILFVGNEARRKGIDQIAAAWRKLPLFVSSQIEMIVVSRFLDGTPSFEGLGWQVVSDISQAKLDELWRTSQVFLLPTHGDTFGVSLVEAMAAGCCVVSSKRSPQDWVLDFGMAGLLVEPSDVDSICNAIQLVATRVERRADLAVKGNRRFKSLFHHRVTGCRYFETFRSTIRVARDERKRR